MAIRTFSIWLLCAMYFLFVFVLFLALYSLTPQDFQVHIVFYSFPSPRIVLFFEAPLFLRLENDIRKQDLYTRIAHCSWAVIASKPLQPIEQRNICVYTNLCVNHTSINILCVNHISINISIHSHLYLYQLLSPTLIHEWIH